MTKEEQDLLIVMADMLYDIFLCTIRVDSQSNTEFHERTDPAKKALILAKKALGLPG